MSEHSAEKDAGLRALPMVKWSDPNPDCLLVKRGESHAAHALSGPGGNKPGSHCGGIDAPSVLPPAAGSGYCPDECTWPHDHRFERDGIPWPARSRVTPHDEGRA